MQLGVALLAFRYLLEWITNIELFAILASLMALAIRRYLHFNGEVRHLLSVVLARRRFACNLTGCINFLVCLRARLSIVQLLCHRRDLTTK